MNSNRGVPGGPAQQPSISRFDPGNLLWILPLAFLGLFFFYPLVQIFSLSFARSPGSPLLPIAATLRSQETLHVLGFTFGQAAASTLLTLMVGLPGAYLFGRYAFRGKSALRALSGIPFVLPTVVVAAAFTALLGPRGWINQGLMQFLHLTTPPINFVNTLAAILLAHVFYNTTIVLRMVGDFWSHLDPNLGAAARTLGASRWRAWTNVTLPLLAPAILAAALLVFLFDFTSFGVILLLGGPRFATLEVEIYYQTVSLFNLPTAAVLSLLQLACTLGLTIIYTRLAGRLSRPITLRSARLTQQPLRTWKERFGAGILAAVLLAILVSPLAALGLRSFTRYGSAPRGQAVEQGWTLANYQQLAQNPQSSIFYVPPTAAIRNSLAYASATVFLSLAIGAPAAWALARDGRSRLTRWLDPLLMLPLGTSAVTLGLGFIVALDHPPLDLRASPLLLPIAHTLVAFPFVVRSLAPALASIQPELRQAAAVLGATPRQVLRFIDLPLVGRALLVSAVFAFTISIGEFGATALIARPEYPTVPIAIFRFLSRPGAINFGQAMALSTVLMVVTAAGMLAIERMRIAEVGEF
ncbi:MAG: ABC transporter permease [Anaerolineales bacterium]